MSQRLLSIFAGAAVIAFLTVAAAPLPQDNQIGVASSLADAKPLPTRFAVDCSHPRNAEETGVCEQRTATGIALTANALAERNFWVSLASIFGLIVSVFFAARATISAEGATKIAAQSAAGAEEGLRLTRMSADAAAKHAEIAERSFLLGERPWLGIDRVEIQDAPKEPWVIIYTKNFGRSPALDVRTAYQFSVFGTDEEPSHPPIGNEVGRSVVFPGAHVRNSLFPKRPNITDMASFAMGSQTAWVTGTVRYRDTYGKEYITKFKRYYRSDVNAFAFTESGEHIE